MQAKLWTLELKSGVLSTQTLNLQLTANSVKIESKVFTECEIVSKVRVRDGKSQGRWHSQKARSVKKQGSLLESEELTQHQKAKGEDVNLTSQYWIPLNWFTQHKAVCSPPLHPWYFQISTSFYYVGKNGFRNVLIFWSSNFHFLELIAIF